MIKTTFQGFVRPAMAYILSICSFRRQFNSMLRLGSFFCQKSLFSFVGCFHGFGFIVFFLVFAQQVLQSVVVCLNRFSLPADVQIHLLDLVLGRQ